MESLDSIALLWIGRSEMADLLVLIDMAAAAIFTYVAVFVSRNFGFGTFEQKLQTAHRFALLFVAFCFAWHAEDIASNTAAHGLAFSNLALHVGILTITALGAFRLHRASKNEEHLKQLIQQSNGGAFFGPYPFRDRH